MNNKLNTWQIDLYLLSMKGYIWNYWPPRNTLVSLLIRPIEMRQPLKSKCNLKLRCENTSYFNQVYMVGIGRSLFLF